MPNGTQAPANAGGPTQHTQNQAQPTIHQAMALVMRDVRNVGKNGRNNSQNYSFRGVDDAIAALAQPLRDHGVFMTPEVLDCESESRGKMNAVRMRVAFHFYGPAGDSVRAVTMGEASDVADKASNKAMSAALKYALIHTFMIPVDAKSLDDGDRDHPVGHRSPADAYVERLRKPMVWNNPAALAAMHAEVKADGLLDSTVPGPDCDTTLGDLIVARGTSLKTAAAEREAQRAEEAPKAAAQVAAEHGVVQPAAQEEDSAAPDPLEALMEKVSNSWKNAMGMKQNLLEGKKLGVLDVMVPSKAGPVKLGDLMQSRIDQLEADSQERNAA
ncbi:ERF family protein [Streptomyces nigrescens]